MRLFLTSTLVNLLDILQLVCSYLHHHFFLFPCWITFFFSSGKPAVLSLVPKAKQITLIGALSEDGFLYHKLLTADNTKAKGVGADDFCLFLGSLGLRLPNNSVIIMDKTPIHQGKWFSEVKESLNTSKSISVEFLPPYSPFLNLIEYSFHSIKAFVQSKEPPNWSALVTEIKNAISEAITPEKSSNFFSHCRRLYRSCSEMQQITGPLLASPPEWIYCTRFWPCFLCFFDN